MFQGRLGARPVAIKKIHGMLVEYARDTTGNLATVLADFRRECELLEAAPVPRRLQPGQQRAIGDGADAGDVGAVPPRQQRDASSRGAG